MAFVKKKESEWIDQDDRKKSRGCFELLNSLHDSLATTRRWAARDLVNCPNAAQALVDQLKCETDLSVREVILTFAKVHLAGDEP